MSSHLLSKSHVLSGIQCAKRLWLEIHRPDSGVQTDAQAIRHVLGDQAIKAARTLYPEGKLIGHPDNPEEAARETRKILSEPDEGVFFEPAFLAGKIFLHARILVKYRNTWKLIETKSSTSVKGYYVWDCAISAWVMRQAGITLDQIQIAFIDKDFVYRGNGDYSGLFRFRDITERVNAATVEIPSMLGRIDCGCADEMPETGAGAHCFSPHHCQFLGLCTTNEAEYPVSILARSGRLRSTLDAKGYRDVREVPEHLLTKEFQLKIHRATITGIPEIDPYMGIRLSRYEHPRYFLDFETIQFGVPAWEGTHPFEQLLFQWSCHKRDSAGTLTHASFLDISGMPPMEKAAVALIGALGKSGPIFVYSSFEKSVIAGLMEDYPHLARELQPIMRRIVDLLPLLRKYYYHKQMKGSWSIKRILPTIAPELSYENLSEVKVGVGVQVAYKEAIAPVTSEERRAEIAARLSEYCKLDTLAMVRIVDFFENMQAGQGRIRGIVADIIERAFDFPSLHVYN